MWVFSIRVVSTGGVFKRNQNCTAYNTFRITAGDQLGQTEHTCTHRSTAGGLGHARESCRKVKSLHIRLTCRRSSGRRTNSNVYCSPFATLLDEAKCTPLETVSERDFGPPDHAPQSLPGTQTCVIVYRLYPYVTGSRERETRHRGRRASTLASTYCASFIVHIAR